MPTYIRSIYDAEDHGSSHRGADKKYKPVCRKEATHIGKHMRDNDLCSQVSQHIGDALNPLMRNLAGIFRSCDIAGSRLIGRLCRIGGNGLI